MPAPFPINPYLTGISIEYVNPDLSLIADQVLPRVDVDRQDFKYYKYNLAEGFTLPDTKVGRRGQPGEVEFSATEATASTVDYALDDPVPYGDIANADGRHDPLMKATERLTNLILLDREKRVADAVFNASNYAAANKATLSGTSQWSDGTNSDPIDAILAALDGMVWRANVLVMGQAVWTKVRQHPKVVQKVLGTASTTGMVSRQALADALELQEVLVGTGWVNSAKKGQSASLSRVWGKHAALIFRDRSADTNGGTTYGFTAQFGTRIAGSERDSKVGMRGAERVRVGESVAEVICANDLGYLFTNAVA